MPDTPTVSDMMEAYAQDAVDHAKATFDVALDFSPASVKEVERFLATMHTAVPKGFLARLFSRGPSADEIDQMCKMYGGYVGEILRRNGGGEWYLDEEIMPGSVFPGLKKGERRIWPPAKVGKRLTNGAEDNVWHYFQVIQKDW